MTKQLIIIGGGLAGTEAQPGRRPNWVWKFSYGKCALNWETPAHVTGDLAELVCSNSLGSNLPHKAPGLLKRNCAVLAP
ncbi:MAG: FAD-dependent oxidoreductase [Chloroflexi bacterium]|nr:FAD-dependent oxidoreductase [Chloroflexota bacterium]